MPEDRRHAAIMFTDIVGYTSLMGRDEDAAFDMLSRNHELHESLIQKHNGTFIKEIGDGVLASFTLASNAVRCAIDIQKEAKEQNIQLKVGIHEGEMVFVGGDVLGDGVNIASRLQEYAQAGGITISGNVYSDVKNKAGINIKLVGDKNLKNVSDPVKVYEVLSDEEADQIQNHETHIGSRVKYFVIASIAVIILGIIIWQIIPAKKRTHPSFEFGIEEIDKSIAVLPFDYLSEDQGKKYQADGVSNAITNHLSKIKILRVIGKTSTEKFKNSSGDPREIGEELEVSYLLEGSFQLDGNIARLSVGLISTMDGSTVWFEEYDREWNDILVVQSEVAKKVVDEIKILISPKEKQDIEVIQTSDITAYDFYLKGEEYRNRSYDMKDFQYALQMYEKAIEIDPKYTLAWVGLAATSRQIYYSKYDISEEQLVKTRQYLDKAIKLSPNSKEVLLEEGRYHYHCRRDYHKAIQILEKLKAEYPKDNELYFWIGMVFRRMGEFRKSLEYNNYAIELNPSKWGYWMDAGNTLVILGEYREAEKYYKKVINLNPSYWLPHKWILDLYLLMGDVKSSKEFLKNNPEFIDHPGIKTIRVYIEILEENYDEAIKITESLTDEVIPELGFYQPRNLQLGMIYYLMSNKKMAHKYFEEARKIFEENIKELNNDWTPYNKLGIAYAGLGRKSEALEAGQKAVDILNLNSDPYTGFYSEMGMIKILLMVEEYDEVLMKLEFLLNQNGNISVELLNIDPFWNPVRDMDKFQEIITNPKYQIDLSKN